MKAALPLAKSLATASCHSNNTVNRWMPRHNNRHVTPSAFHKAVNQQNDNRWIYIGHVVGGERYLGSRFEIGCVQWASCQIRKIAGCACAGNAGNVFPRRQLQMKPLVNYPSMHHGTCVTHVPWCMSGSLFRGGGENVPGIPGACTTRNFTHLARGPYHSASTNRFWWRGHGRVVDKLAPAVGGERCFWDYGGSAGKWVPSQYKYLFPVMGIPMLKIKRSQDRLIFNMGIPILVRRYLYFETPPPWFLTNEAINS